RTAAVSMPRLMKSIESSRRHRCSADEPEYFPFAASAPRLTRSRAPRLPLSSPCEDPGLSSVDAMIATYDSSTGVGEDLAQARMRCPAPSLRDLVAPSRCPSLSQPFRC